VIRPGALTRYRARARARNRNRHSCSSLVIVTRNRNRHRNGHSSSSLAPRAWASITITITSTSTTSCGRDRCHRCPHSCWRGVVRISRGEGDNTDCADFADWMEWVERSGWWGAVTWLGAAAIRQIGGIRVLYWYSPEHGNRRTKTADHCCLPLSPRRAASHVLHRPCTNGLIRTAGILPALSGASPPRQSRQDAGGTGLLVALHLAVATLNRMDYVVTWNCEHIARGRVKRRLEEINRAQGLHVPVVCTPEELFYENGSLD